MKLKQTYYSEWDVPSISQESYNQILALFEKPFYYLSQGSQCYVFESENGLYVIKLFRFDQTHNPIRAFFREKIKKRPPPTNSTKKISQLFLACRLAYTLARHETELCYVHLNLTEKTLPSILLKDRLGRSFRLPLDSYRFVLQKKAKPFKEVLLSAAQSENLQPYLDSFLSLLEQRSSKGISNSDGSLFRNFGFIGDRAVEIDFGSYKYNTDLFLKCYKKQEISRFASNLRIWLQNNAPQWVSYLDEKIESL